MDVLDHLMEEHRKVEGLLSKLADTEDTAKRSRLVDEIEQSLAVHMAVEERFVYPLVPKAIDQEAVEEADIEHDLAREGLAKVRSMVAEPGFGAAVDMLTAGIAHHVEEEENEMFPKLRKKVGDQLAAMDPEELEAQVKADGVPATGSKRPSRSVDHSVDLTKEELYEQARKANVPGRSQMTKDELAEALAKA